MIKDDFQINYGNSLVTCVKDDTSCNFRILLICLIQTNRSINKIQDLQLCRNDADNLYQVDEGRWGTDEYIFFKIFSQSYLAEMNFIYKLLSKNKRKKFISSYCQRIF